MNKTCILCVKAVLRDGCRTEKEDWNKMETRLTKEINWDRKIWLKRLYHLLAVKPKHQVKQYQQLEDHRKVTAYNLPSNHLQIRNTHHFNSQSVLDFAPKEKHVEKRFAFTSSSRLKSPMSNSLFVLGKRHKKRYVIQNTPKACTGLANCLPAPHQLCRASPEIVEQNKTNGTNEYSSYDICRELILGAASGSAFKWARIKHGGK